MTDCPVRAEPVTEYIQDLDERAAIFRDWQVASRRSQKVGGYVGIMVDSRVMNILSMTIAILHLIRGASGHKVQRRWYRVRRVSE